MAKKKVVEDKFEQLYSVKIDRLQGVGYGRVSVGEIQYTLSSGKIKEAYQLACKKGEEVFGKSTYQASTGKGEYNVVQVRIAPMSRIEK